MQDVVRLVVQSADDKLELALCCYSLRLSAAYLESLTDTFSSILDTLLSSPDQMLTDLNYVGDRQLQRITAWNGTSIERVDRCIHDLIYEQVLERPQHEAIRAWDGSLTYRALWTYVERLARVLMELGLGPEDVVPLCFEKSLWSTVAMLSVMEVGAAFCPLDATQPKARVQALSTRLGARVLLCSPSYSQALESVAGLVMSVDAKTFNNAFDGTAVKMTRAAPDNIAYVLWTSGSTGEPKGVVIEHRAFCSAALTHAPIFRMTPESRVLTYASYVFDASLVENLTSLIVGATTCIPSEHARLNDLPAAINNMNADWAALTPSVASLLDPSLVPSLKSLLLMGEAMSQEHITKWSSIQLCNGYGPAECSVAAVANPNVHKTKEPTLIGQSLGVHLWLVDPEDHNRLLPPGCVAELIIEGPTLARGYLNEPQKTHDAFIENPTWTLSSHSQQSTRRMYKTGDLVRYHTPTGMLYFVGRKDTQVKLHGQRVELGEIEHHLEGESVIRQSMVLVPKEGFCKQRLVAVISLRGMLTANTLANAEDIRLVDRAGQERAEPIIQAACGRLSSRLPPFMLPSIWLVVEGIPLLRSGKLDRKAVLHRVQELDEEVYTQWVQKGDCVEQPATPLEAQLRSICGHILNIQPSNISLKKSFLDLSGDSISAMMVQSQCKKNDIHLSVQQILRAKSLSHLATSAQTIGRKIKHEERIEEEFDLSPIQSLYFALPRGTGHFNQSVFLRLTRMIEPATLKEAVRALVNRHSMLRARFRLSVFDDEWKQRITTDVAGSYSYLSKHCRTEEDVLPYISKTQTSIDPVNGPLLGVNLFHIESGYQLLFMTAHHLVVDLVSWRVLLQDIEELLISPKSAADTDPSVPFQTWCTMQLEYAHRVPLNTVLPLGDIPDQSHAYWGMQDRADLYGEVLCHGFQLPADRTAVITSHCHGALRTDIVDILIASILYSFSQIFTDREPLTVFNEGHGREVWDESIDLSRTVGWFTTMYPIYISSSPSRSFFDVVRRVKDYRRAVPAKGRSYFASRMLTAKGSKKFASHWPLELTFNYLGVYQQLEREDALLLPVDDLAGEARAAGGKSDVGHSTYRFGLFEASAVIAQGELRFSFTYNRHMRHQEQIQSWISLCQKTLLTMPTKLAQMDYQPTLSDFPLLALDYKGLDQLTLNQGPQSNIPDFNEIEDVYKCSQIQQGLLISKQRDGMLHFSSF